MVLSIILYRTGNKYRTSLKMPEPNLVQQDVLFKKKKKTGMNILYSQLLGKCSFQITVRCL